MTERPIDLSPLDPTRDADAFDTLSRALADEAMTARRKPRVDALAELTRWTRPALAAAVVIAAAATFALASVGTAAPSETGMDAVGIPRAVAEWTHTNYHPSPLEVVVVLGAGGTGGAGR